MSDMEEGGEVNGLPLDDVFVLQLRKPIELGSLSWDTLTFREPTAGELRKALSEVGPPMASSMSLAQQTASPKVPMRVIEAIPARDFQKVDSFFGKLLRESSE